MSKTEADRFDDLAMSDTRLARIYDYLLSIRKSQVKVFAQLKQVRREVNTVLEKEPRFAEEFESDLQAVRDIMKARKASKS